MYKQNNYKIIQIWIEIAIAIVIKIQIHLNQIHQLKILSKTLIKHINKTNY